MSTCAKPCDPCACAPPAKRGCAEVSPVAKYRIVASSGAILAAGGSSVVVQFPSAGRLYAVRGSVTALGGHGSLDAALMNVRAGWSIRNADPAVRQNNGVSAGTASMLSLFGRDLTEEQLFSEDGEDGICIGQNDTVMVNFADAAGSSTSQAELAFYFEPKVS